MTILGLSWGRRKKRQSAGRTASTISSRRRLRTNLAHQAAKDVFREPLTNSFHEVRRQQQKRARKRYGTRVRFSHSSGTGQWSTPVYRRKHEQSSYWQSIVDAEERGGGIPMRYTRELPASSTNPTLPERMDESWHRQGEHFEGGGDCGPNSRLIPRKYRFSELPDPEGNPHWDDVPPSPQQSPQPDIAKRVDNGKQKYEPA
jgi:hypothetical protein